MMRLTAGAFGALVVCSRTETLSFMNGQGPKREIEREEAGRAADYLEGRRKSVDPL